jgi:hypothetical protein
MTEILLKVALNTIKHLPTCTLSTFIAMFWVSVLIVVVILSVRYYQYCLLLITNILHLFLGCITWWWLLYWRTCPVWETQNIAMKVLSVQVGRCFMVFNATFNKISVISLRSVLLAEEIGVPIENHQPAASHWQTLSHNVVSSTPI